MPYMPTLTPKTTPTDRHIWQSHGVSGIETIRSNVLVDSTRLLHPSSGASGRAFRPGQVERPRPVWSVYKQVWCHYRAVYAVYCAVVGYMLPDIANSGFIFG